MSTPTARRPRWWRVWFATAAVIPLVAGGAAIASYATTDVDSTDYPIWPAIAFVAVLLALGAWMLASARREGTHR